MNIAPLTGTTFGAVVEGVQLAALSDAEWDTIHDAFLSYGVLVFPAQHLTDDEQGAFARRFGEIEKLSPKQEGGTVSISNQMPDGSVFKPDSEGFKVLAGNEGWHTDSTYMPLASKAAMLAALVVPPTRGETEFADMRAAWDEIPADMQAKLEGWSAYHSLYYSQEKAGIEHNTDKLYGYHSEGAPLRPVVKVHPETGRKSLYTGRHAHNLVGEGAPDSAEGEQLLDSLMRDACQPPRVYRHEWQVGDLVVWDNRCVMHRACDYDKTHARVLRGSRIAGDPETELAPTHPDPRAAAFKARLASE